MLISDHHVRSPILRRTTLTDDAGAQGSSQGPFSVLSIHLLIPRSGNMKLTNVSIVRLKKAGKQFSIACYKNSVRAWRSYVPPPFHASELTNNSGAQKDLSEVLQIDNVFTNVPKGLVAPAADLTKAFGTTDLAVIVLEILAKGELQVGEKERAMELEDLRKEICTEVAGRCVDPGTNRPYTVGMIEKAFGEVGYSVNTSKSAKVQVRPSLSDRSG